MADGGQRHTTSWIFKREKKQLCAKKNMAFDQLKPFFKTMGKKSVLKVQATFNLVHVYENDGAPLFSNFG